MGWGCRDGVGVWGWGARRTMPAGVRGSAFKTFKNVHCKSCNLEVFC